MNIVKFLGARFYVTPYVSFCVLQVLLLTVVIICTAIWVTYVVIEPQKFSKRSEEFRKSLHEKGDK